MESVSNFAVGYLHQDWQDDYENFDEALADFLDEADRSIQIDLAKNLSLLLKETSSDEELEAVLNSLGWNVFFDDVPTQRLVTQVIDALLNE